MEMAKRRVNEPGINFLQNEVNSYKREQGQFRQEIEQLRNDRVMLLEILTDMTNEDSYWNTDAETQTMRWRVKNLVNNLKSS
jgi:predicted RNase H-like nuclease (RuvC/YqgF family)